MTPVPISGLIKWIRANKPRWVGWFLLVFYISILYLMAQEYWHVKFPFIFLGILLILTLFTVLAFRMILKPEESSGDGEDDLDKTLN